MLRDAIIRHNWDRTESAYLLKNQVEKTHGVKFYQCPVSVITEKTWRLIQLVNDTTDAEGNNLIGSGYLSMPPYYRQAVRIVKAARAENFRHKHKK